METAQPGKRFELRAAVFRLEGLRHRFSQNQQEGVTPTDDLCSVLVRVQRVQNERGPPARSDAEDLQAFEGRAAGSLLIEAHIQVAQARYRKECSKAPLTKLL